MRSVPGAGARAGGLPAARRRRDRRADAATARVAGIRCYGGGNYDMVLTRLHTRYGKDLKDDLVFKAADPIVGGREFVVDQQDRPARRRRAHRLDEQLPGPLRDPPSVDRARSRARIRAATSGVGNPNGGYQMPIAATGPRVRAARPGPAAVGRQPRRARDRRRSRHSRCRRTWCQRHRARPRRDRAYAPTKTNGCQTSDPGGVGRRARAPRARND